MEIYSRLKIFINRILKQILYMNKECLFFKNYYTEKMDKIPKEIWNIIINKLDIHQVIKFMYVNKYFYNVVMNNYITHNINNDKIIKSVLIQNVMTRIKYVNLYIMKNVDNIIIFIIKTFPNIKYIDVGPMGKDEHLLKDIINYVKDRKMHDLTIHLCNGKDSKSDIEILKKVYPNLTITRRFCAFDVEISVQFKDICHECGINTDDICKMCDMHTCSSCFEGKVCKGCILGL